MPISPVDWIWYPDEGFYSSQCAQYYGSSRRFDQKGSKNPMTEAPRDWSSKDSVDEPHEHPADVSSRGAVMRAWLPWVILSVFVFLWGTPQVKTVLDGIWIGSLPVTGLHNLVMKVPPVVAEPHAEA